QPPRRRRRPRRTNRLERPHRNPPHRIPLEPLMTTTRTRVTEPEIEKQLRDGLSDREISRRLHVDAKAVARLRADLGLPKHRPGYAAMPLADLWQSRTRDAGDGHTEWTG